MAPQGKLPCAYGTYYTQEADIRIPYVQYGGSGAYSTEAPGRMCKLRRLQLSVRRDEGVGVGWDVAHGPHADPGDA